MLMVSAVSGVNVRVNWCLQHSVLTVGPDQQDELPGVTFTAGFDEHDHLVVSVLRNITTVYQNHLITLVKPGHTQISLYTRQEQE